MFYIKHGSDNFSIIDSSLPDDRADAILHELVDASRGKGVIRFISTHPDQDHIEGLVDLDDRMKILNFYCVDNRATKSEETDDFKRYRSLRDDAKKAFHLQSGCRRKWMNVGDDERGSAGINILWPVLSNQHFKDALREAEDGGSPNNISPVIKYSLQGGATILWMGDLETDFMDDISDSFTPDAADILFAPHHGRWSGRVPGKWLEAIGPKIVVVGEAPSADLTYYDGYDTITQNSAGDIVFECVGGKTHVFVSERDYAVDFLDQENVANTHGYYLGTLYV